MKSSELSFISFAEHLTIRAYKYPREYSVIASELIGRVAAAILLTPAAALDFTAHSLLIIPTIIYSMGKSVYQREVNFILPWQHTQRVRNAVAPLLFGSVFGVLHPYAGLVMSEATDKQTAIGILGSNVGQTFETPCSPIHSLAIVEALARRNRFATVDGVKHEIFTAGHIEALSGARKFEESLEGLQSQEFVHKITNVTLAVMAIIKISADRSRLNPMVREVLVRASGVLIPVLTTVDILITFIMQAMFLSAGIARVISGRGPIYTEVTTNPLMHVSFLIQNILKTVGNLVGTFVWFISPMTGFKCSLLPSNLFFKMQMNVLQLQIKLKMHFCKDNERFVVPIVLGHGTSSAFDVPSHTSHKMYLIVEKKSDLYNLFWVNRPNITSKHGLSPDQALVQIRAMLDERFPFMDMQKMMEYPVKNTWPKFEGAIYAEIASQGNITNCVVSNMFGMLETLDLLNGFDGYITVLRNKVVRSALMNDYGFYKGDFSPSAQFANYHLHQVWQFIEVNPTKPI